MFYPHTIKGKVNLRRDIISEIIPPDRPGPICTINTTVLGPSTSNVFQFQLPLIETEGYFFEIDWGDGQTDNIADPLAPEALHTYSTPGQYDIGITGVFPTMAFDGGGDAIKMVDWKEWNEIKLSEAMFDGCINITFSSTDTFEVLGTSLARAFRDCASVVSITNLDLLDTSLVTDISSMFRDATLFNQGLNLWNVSSVINAAFSFANAVAFNGNVASWSTGNMTDMAAMFLGASSFNRNISFWNVEKVISIGGMFLGATIFNQPIGSWTTPEFATLEFIFQDAIAFNQDLSHWDVSKVLEMQSAFQGATAFNQDISGWLVPLVADMENMLDDCGMDQTNYDLWLIALDAQTLQVGIPMGAAGRIYTRLGAGGIARDALLLAPALMEITGDLADKVDYNMSNFDNSRGVSVPDHATLDMTNDFAACAFVYPHNRNKAQFIIGKYHNAGNQTSWLLGITISGVVNFWHSVDGAAETIFTSTMAVPLNTLSLVHFRLTGGTLYLGLNGALEQSIARGACFSGSANVEVGMTGQGGIFNDDFDITKAMILDSGSSLAEMLTIYNGGFPLEHNLLEIVDSDITDAAVLELEMSSNDTSLIDKSSAGNDGSFAIGSFTNGQSIPWQTQL